MSKQTLDQGRLTADFWYQFWCWSQAQHDTWSKMMSYVYFMLLIIFGSFYLLNLTVAITAKKYQQVPSCSPTSALWLIQPRIVMRSAGL